MSWLKHLRHTYCCLHDELDWENEHYSYEIPPPITQEEIDNAKHISS